jgi:hypothetical protein
MIRGVGYEEELAVRPEMTWICDVLLYAILGQGTGYTVLLDPYPPGVGQNNRFPGYWVKWANMEEDTYLVGMIELLQRCCVVLIYRQSLVHISM